MMMFISNGKTTCFGLQRPSSVLATFLLEEFYIICLNRVVMLRSIHHFTCFVKLKFGGMSFGSMKARKMMMRSQHHHTVQAHYIKLFQQEISQNLKMAAIGRNMQCFSIANKHHHLAIIYSCVFYRIHLTIQFKHTMGMAHLRITNQCNVGIITKQQNKHQGYNQCNVGKINSNQPQHITTNRYLF